MRITVFTSNQPRHISLIESLASIADEVFAIQECNTVFPGQVDDFFRKSPVMQDYFSRVIAAEREVFGDARFPNRPNVRQLPIRMGDVSRLDVQTLAPALKADVFVVFGASYIKGPLCDALVDRRAINIHMGISPQYRGSSTNFWAMYDRRPEFVGATIHRLSKGLDSGPILFHALPKAGKVDPFVFGMLAVRGAHRALVDKIASAQIGDIEPIAQDRTHELRYTRNADFTDAVAAEYLARLPTPEQMASLQRDEKQYLRAVVLERMSRRLIQSLLMIVLLGAALRVPGMFTDFWLDEIWSLNIAKSIQSPLAVLFSESARIDNNHPLHTWYLYAIGEVEHWWIYRLPALVCGIGSVIAAAMAMSRRRTIEAIVAAMLIAFSFPLVFYSSEARGYAPAAFFALVGFAAMLRYVDRESMASAIVFNLACVFGFLSHLTFVHFYFAAIFWTILRARRTKLPIAQQLIWWARLNALPVLFVVFLFRIFVRDMTIGGAAPTAPIQVLFRSLSLPLGGPDFGVGAVVGACITIALFVAAVAHLMRRRDDLWFFYLLAVVVAPGFLLLYDLVLSQRPQPLMPRYFLVAVTMLLIALAHLAASTNRRVIVGVLLVFCIANIVRTIRFLQVGRGDYSVAIRTILQDSNSRIVTVSTDDIVRVRPMFDFYQPRIVPGDRQIELRDASQSAEWKLTTSQSSELSGFVWKMTRP